MYTFNSKYIRRAMAMAAVVAATVVTSSCIENDLPYPWVQPNVLSVSVLDTDAQGHALLASPVAVDSASRSIALTLTEWADIRQVVVRGIELSDGSVMLDPTVLDEPLDLTTPVEIELERYDRVYVWTISAVQDIERYFTISSQIGTAVIDAEAHTVSAVVPTGQSLEAVRVRTIKLGGVSATMSPDLAGQQADFSSPVEVTVTEHGRQTEWSISVTATDVSVVLNRVDAWSRVAWLYADAEVGKANGFEYRQAASEEWIEVPREWITENGGSFSARLVGLDPMTAYVARATSDEDFSAEVEFTTQAEEQLPNSDFTQWYLDGKVWNPWDDGGTQFWDTGNRGAATLGQSNTVPISDLTSTTGYAGAELQTKYIGISIMGKLGAGNMFAGSYVRTDGTDGVLAFGRPFDKRPTRLHARLKYEPVAITHVSRSNPDFSHMLGEPDTCIVWCALGDWNEPYEVRTKKSDRRLFSPTDAGVIAYGEYQSPASMQDYIEVTVDLDYNATDRVPKYILVTASASKYGDYFTGGNGSVLSLKEYWLDYDY